MGETLNYIIDIFFFLETFERSYKTSDFFVHSLGTYVTHLDYQTFTKALNQFSLGQAHFSSGSIELSTIYYGRPVRKSR